jgi:hypothetical protein
MSEHTNETTIANKSETIQRLIEERDALRRQVAESAPILAAFDDWGVWQFIHELPRDMCGMPADVQAEHIAAKRMRDLWVDRHPEFFRKAIECQPD